MYIGISNATKTFQTDGKTARGYRSLRYLIKILIVRMNNNRGSDKTRYRRKRRSKINIRQLNTGSGTKTFLQVGDQDFSILLVNKMK